MFAEMRHICRVGWQGGRVNKQKITEPIGHVMGGFQTGIVYFKVFKDQGLVRIRVAAAAVSAAIVISNNYIRFSAVGNVILACRGVAHSLAGNILDEQPGRK